MRGNKEHHSYFEPAAASSPLLSEALSNLQKKKDSIISNKRKTLTCL